MPARRFAANCQIQSLEDFESRHWIWLDEIDLELCSRRAHMLKNVLAGFRLKELKLREAALRHDSGETEEAPRSRGNDRPHIPHDSMSLESRVSIARDVATIRDFTSDPESEDVEVICDRPFLLSES